MKQAFHRKPPFYGVASLPLAFALLGLSACSSSPSSHHDIDGLSANGLIHAQMPLRNLQQPLTASNARQDPNHFGPDIDDQDDARPSVHVAPTTDSRHIVYAQKAPPLPQAPITSPLISSATPNAIATADVGVAPFSQPSAPPLAPENHVNLPPTETKSAPFQASSITSALQRRDGLTPAEIARTFGVQQ